MRHTLTILAVDDLDRAAAFYERAFDLQRRVTAPTYVELALEGDRAIGLYAVDGFVRNTAAPAAPRPPPAATTRTELYFVVVDLDEAVLRLRSAGARELSPIAMRGWGDAAAYFADPDGNVLVVARPRDEPR